MLTVNAIALATVVAMALVFYFKPGQPVAAPGPTGFYLPLWVLLLFPLWAVLTTATTVFRPAFNASLPRVLSRGDLGPANGLIYSLAVVGSVGASLGATFLVQSVGTWEALLVPLALLGFTQISIRPIRVNLDPPRALSPKRFLSEAKEGYRFLWQNKPLLEITLSALAINFLNALAFVELGLYVRNWLGVSQALFYGVMVAGSSLGVAAGALYVGRVRFEQRAGGMMILMTVGMGFTVVALGLVRTLWLALPDIFVFGMFPGMITTVFLATLQATVPNQVLGRVMAADEVGSYALVPVWQYTGGVLTLAEGLQTTYLAAGAGTLAVGIVMAGFRGLRQLGFDPDSVSSSNAETPVNGAGVEGAPAT
jgi:MFS family permease